MYLEIQNVSKSFNNVPALSDVSLSIGEHEFVCLLGPSGCGKTTLLRIICGLITADAGQILLEGKDIMGIPAHERGFSIVFQSYSLFPNMTIAENVAYGLKIRHVARSKRAQRVKELLALVKLSGYERRYPWQLSGGQQQRIAIARALAVNPSLLLLDEPLSALDAQVRAQMRVELHQLQRQLAIPTVMVTHDQQEALELSDHVVCMRNGSIEQIGSPEQVYAAPETYFVADFIGNANLMTTDWVRANIPALLASRPEGADEAYHACIRPEAIDVKPAAAGTGRVEDVTFLGNRLKLRIGWRSVTLLADVSSQLGVRIGDAVDVGVDTTNAKWVRV